MPERCLPCRYNEDGTRNYRYSDEGIDLLAKITLNINPLDIDAPDQKSVGKTIRKWNGFISFVRGKVNITETKFNADSSVNNLQELLNNYNTNKSELDKITINDIKKAQIYHQITDPEVALDGRLGTQTFQLLYPDIIIHRNEGDIKDEITGKKIYKLNLTPSDGYLPVSWGSKRYILKSSDYNKTLENQLINFFEVIEKYDPVKYPNNKFYDRRDPSLTWPQWSRLELAQQPTPTPTPEQINLATKKDQFKKEATQKTTDILNSLKT